MNPEKKYEHFIFNVDPKQAPERIDKFLQNKIVNVSRSFIQKAIENDMVIVNDNIVKSNYKVRPNDVIKVMSDMEPRVKATVEGEHIPLDIRYEDDDVIVLYKPPGLVVHPGVGNQTGNTCERSGSLSSNTGLACYGR